ncbi:MAG TPA: PDZ domain-containing protein, partial [Candidatus Polarisedimenticolia bacterium]|nr:PDZ domain-containing protein [Candidatus Polarisedimenticolia bacterium]
GRGLKNLNLVRLPAVQQSLRDAIVRWMIADPREARGGTVLPPDLVKEAAEKTGADLVLAGVTFADDPSRGWTLALYSPLHPVPDTVRLRLDDPAGVKDILARLDAIPPETDDFWGFSLVDSALPPAAPLVARVLPGSPAAKAGVRLGDRLVAVGSRKVATAREAEEALDAESRHAGGVRTGAVLMLQATGEARSTRLSPTEAPALIPLGDPGLLYNRALAEYRLRARLASDDTARAVASLNVGLALMHFRAYDKAISEGLSRATLPAGSGIASGTVDYYRGLCALRRGDPEAAKSALRSAAGAAGSTLESADGPSAAAAAARALQALQ